MTIVVPALRAAVAPGQWVKNELWRNAREVPALDQQFADRRDLIDAISGQQLITFTRASAGTYRGSDGLIKTAVTNEARFDHDPVTGESLGLLVEEQRTNLLLRSEEFDNASWNKAASSISPANAVSAPNGTVSADKLVEDSTLASHYALQLINVTAGASYTLSIYAKAAERSEVYLTLSSFNSAFLDNTAGYFNLAEGTIRSTGVNATSRITDAGNGWYRCSITGTAQTTTSSIINAAATSNGTTFFYTGDGTSGIYIWGAQVEAGSFPTSYIPTTDAAATRAADVASIEGSNFSSWYRQDEGSIFGDTTSFNSDVSKNTSGWGVDADDTTNQNRIWFYHTKNQYIGSTSGSLQYVLDFSDVQANVRLKSGFSYKGNDIAASSNGLTPLVDTSATLPTVDRLFIGKVGFSGTELNGTIRRLVYWGQRLPNSTLQAITQ